SENNRPSAKQPQPPRSGLLQLVIYRSAFRDINIRKGRGQDEGRSVAVSSLAFVEKVKSEQSIKALYRELEQIDGRMRCANLTKLYLRSKIHPPGTQIPPNITYHV